MKKRDYGLGLAQLDMTTTMLLIFVALFIIAFMAMKIEVEKSKKVDAKAEFMITVTWEKSSNDDVDSYAEDPLGNLIFFRRLEEGLMHLDRDDLGARNDRVRDTFGNIIEIQENQEIITIRGIIPGEYVINAHMYRKMDDKPIEVMIHLQKLNPKVITISKKIVLLAKDGDEQTAFRFILDKDGEVTNINDVEKQLASSKNEAQFDNPEASPYFGEEPSEESSEVPRP